MNDISYNTWNAMSDAAISQKIGKFIKHHRVKQNKTQSELAMEAGISRSTLSLLERGQTVTVATLIQVLRMLDQLQVLDGFQILYQTSPLLLARVQEREMKRYVPRRKKETDTEEEVDW
ncbi:helix-turn-helix domain-containing protein [Bacteroidales bacterium OttesenSCG-928-A17]|nr:helix-turn-helix domain-containing protein [Bacteroidales bacterium OttesenSCG-928-A17]